MRVVEVKTVLNRHKRDSWFLDEYSVNPYYGCQFSCVYCYTRGRFRGPQDLAAKVNAPQVLEKQLKRRAAMREYGFIAIGTSTEPYMQVERELMITRRVLEVIYRYRFPVHVLTKSTLVTRDVDILKGIADRAVIPEDLEVSGALVTFSMSTLDRGLSRLLEPGAPPPEERFKALKEVKERGIEAGVAFMPIIPYLSDGDEELREMVKRAKESGASYVFFGALTLSGFEDFFLSFLKKVAPNLVERYKKLYWRGYPKRSYQEDLHKRAALICKEEGVRMGITGKLGS